MWNSQKIARCQLFGGQWLPSDHGGWVTFEGVAVAPVYISIHLVFIRVWTDTKRYHYKGYIHVDANTKCSMLCRCLWDRGNECYKKDISPDLQPWTQNSSRRGPLLHLLIDRLAFSSFFCFPCYVLSKFWRKQSTIDRLAGAPLLQTISFVSPIPGLWLAALSDSTAQHPSWRKIKGFYMIKLTDCIRAPSDGTA